MLDQGLDRGNQAVSEFAFLHIGPFLARLRVGCQLTIEPALLPALAHYFVSPLYSPYPQGPF